MKVAADTHAIVWFLHRSASLSEAARQALRDAEGDEGIIVPVGVLFDLWYVTETTKAFGKSELVRVHDVLNDPANAIDVAPADETVFAAWERIDRKIIKDPWDRMIMAGAIALKVPLVTKDGQITASGLVPTIW